jgi:hypothetical protein
MDVAPRWYDVGFMLGGIHSGDEDESHTPPAPTSADLFKQLAEGWEDVE